MDKEKETNETGAISGVKLAGKGVLFVKFLIVSLITFLIANGFLILMLIIIGFFVAGAVIAIVLLFNIDIANVPYFYTKEETKYNLPVISYDYVKEYGSTQFVTNKGLFTDSIELDNKIGNLQGFMDAYGENPFTTDLISNIYFYSDNQQFLSKILYPTRVLDVGNLYFHHGEMYSKTPGVDFYYSFTDSGSIQGLDTAEAKQYAKHYKEVSKSGALFSPVIKELVSFTDTTGETNNVKKQIAVDREVLGYGITFNRVIDTSSPMYGNYRVEYYLDFGKDLKKHIFDTLFNASVRDSISNQLLKEINQKEPTKFDEFLKKRYNVSGEVKVPNGTTFFDMVTDYAKFVEFNTKAGGIIKCLNAYDISLEKIRADRVMKCEGSDLTDFEKVREIYVQKKTNELVQNPDFLERLKTWLRNEIKYANTKNMGGAKNPQLTYSNPYFWFYEDYDAIKNEYVVKTDKLSLNPQVHLFSINKAKNDMQLDTPLGFDYVKMFLSNGTNDFTYTYGNGIQENTDNLVNRAVFTNEDNYFITDFKNKYFPNGSIRKQTYDYSNFSTSKGKLASNKSQEMLFSKHWNYFVYGNYPENFDYYNIGDYYYLNGNSTNSSVSQNKDASSKMYFNMYDLKYVSDNQRVNTIPRKEIYENQSGFSTFLDFTLGGFVDKYNAVFGKKEAVMLIDKGSEFTFKSFASQNSQSDKRIDKKDMEEFGKNLFGNGEYNSNLDSKLNTPRDKSELLGTQFFFLFNGFQDRTNFQNASYFIQSSFNATLTDTDMNMVFNGYSMLLNNHKIESDYKKVLDGERNPFEFITYFYERNNDTNAINMGEFIRSFAKSDSFAKEQLEVEATYQKYHDFWNEYLKWYSKKENIDIKSAITTKTDYCKRYENEASCFATLDLFEKVEYAKSNREYYEYYIEFEKLLNK